MLARSRGIDTAFRNRLDAPNYFSRKLDTCRLWIVSRYDCSAFDGKKRGKKKKRIAALFGSWSPAKIDAQANCWDTSTVIQLKRRAMLNFSGRRVRTNYSGGQTRLIPGHPLKLVRPDLYFGFERFFFCSVLFSATDRFRGKLQIFPLREQREQ